MSIENKTVPNIRSDRLAAARASAKLIRDKKAAAVLARAEGKVKAAEQRAKAAEEYENLVEKENAILLSKIAKARKAMGVRKNEENPSGIRQMIENWKWESYMRTGAYAGITLV